MTPEDYRDLALTFPQAHQGSHFDTTDFRVGKKIFATYRPSDGRAVLKLSPDEQALLTESSPAVFEPVHGSWGLRGWTILHLAEADSAMVRHALGFAWRSVAPKKLRLQ